VEKNLNEISLTVKLLSILNCCGFWAEFFGADEYLIPKEEKRRKP